MEEIFKVNDKKSVCFILSSNEEKIPKIDAKIKFFAKALHYKSKKFVFIEVDLPEGKKEIKELEINLNKIPFIISDIESKYPKNFLFRHKIKNVKLNK